MTPMLLFGVVGESQEDDVQGLAKLSEKPHDMTCRLGSWYMEFKSLLFETGRKTPANSD